MACSCADDPKGHGDGADDELSPSHPLRTHFHRVLIAIADLELFVRGIVWWPRDDVGTCAVEELMRE